jgi:hypothetical protein
MSEAGLINRPHADAIALIPDIGCDVNSIADVEKADIFFWDQRIQNLSHTKSVEYWADAPTPTRRTGHHPSPARDRGRADWAVLP